MMNKYIKRICSNGVPDKGNGYRVMRNTKLKEMYIIRYADDFRIFCRTKAEAERTKIAITQWLEKRLKLEISQEKTRVVNVKRKYSEFLGFKIKVHKKSDKYVVKSHVSDKKIKIIRNSLAKQAKRIAKPTNGKSERDEIMLYNAMVVGEQNYYCLATDVSIDFHPINRMVMTILTNRLRRARGCRLTKGHTTIRKKNKSIHSEMVGRKLSKYEKDRYGNSRMLRFIKGSDEPIYPIGYVHNKIPMAKKRSICQYTVEGRKGLHDNLRINTSILLELMRQPIFGRSVEYADNRLSLYSAQWGRCAVTGIEFPNLSKIHCHHKTPRMQGGDDRYGNLVLVLETVHKLVHAVSPETITLYLNLLKLTPKQLEKLNILRKQVGISEITI